MGITALASGTERQHRRLPCSSVLPKGVMPGQSAGRRPTALWDMVVAGCVGDAKPLRVILSEKVLRRDDAILFVVPGRHWWFNGAIADLQMKGSCVSTQVSMEVGARAACRSLKPFVRALTQRCPELAATSVVGHVRFFGMLVVAERGGQHKWLYVQLAWGAVVRFARGCGRREPSNMERPYVLVTAQCIETNDCLARCSKMWSWSKSARGSNRQQAAVDFADVTPVKAARKLLNGKGSANTRWTKSFLNMYLVSTRRAMHAGGGGPVDLGVAADARRVGEKKGCITAINHHISEKLAWATVQDKGYNDDVIGWSLWHTNSNVAFRRGINSSPRETSFNTCVGMQRCDVRRPTSGARPAAKP